jgi:hypothetical protein
MTQTSLPHNDSVARQCPFRPFRPWRPFSLPAAAFAIALGGLPAADSPPSDTTAGWVKHPGNPLTGGQYGTARIAAFRRQCTGNPIIGGKDGTCFD